MHLPLIFISAILLAVTLVNGDKEKYSNYYANRKQQNLKRVSLLEPERPPPTTDEEDESPGCILKVECKSRKGEPGFPGIPGEDGIRGLTGFQGLAGMKGGPGDSGGSGSPVAFFAALDKNKGPLIDQVLPYKRVVVNHGSAYDPVTGKFTAPSSGVYVFNMVVAAQKGEKAAVKLFKTVDGVDNWVVTVLAESLPSWGTSSNTVYISLTQGQQVYLIASGDLTSYYYASMYTTFSGHLVTPAE
ncbi:complement C1q-like protein 4 [Mizuhopecten yessoensis]|uniref:complement C1q-like protein 4 n=1 Tax=Mizuhopecten yessoensis TaxID=6573 RepID=UPI000B458D2E|nr:complement C1q-like protein 4 [Mizuhopecten yessoensis]